MAVDLAVCRKRVTALLNANAKNADGTMVYSEVVADDRRHATEIADSVTEAALVVLRAIARSSSEGRRGSLMGVSGNILHGNAIPTHIGPIGVVLIQRFDFDPFRAARGKRSIDEIESMRDNVHNLYSETAHDQPDANGDASPIAGFFAELGDELYYTGFLARVRLANVARADAANKVPDDCEDLVVAIAFTICVKDGDVNLTNLASHYQSWADKELMKLEAGSVLQEPIPEVQARAA